MTQDQWKFREAKPGIGILELDVPDTDVNILNPENLGELRKKILDINQQSTLKALLITSAKPRIFIAGADIKEIQSISTEEQAIEKAEQGKEVFKALEDCRIPTITVINGPCLGGGYELALSTTFRVASFSDKIKIGLPEVNLGILPGFGGSIRLPELVGLVKALPLILAGQMVSSRDAYKKGMIDKLFTEKTLLEDAVAFAETVVSKGAAAVKKKRRQDLMTQFLENTKIGQGIVFKKARKDVMEKSKGFYPAPLKVIELLEKTYGMSDRKQAFRLESEAFGKLGATEISKNLIKLFFLSEKYKKVAWTQTKAAAKPIHKVGVIGAGVMGGGIAQLVSSRNIPVRVKDINDKALGGALAEARRIYEGALKRRKIKKTELENKMGLISVGLTTRGLKRADIIIEAVVEDMKIKKKVFEELDGLAGPNAILASNTSSLSVTEMGTATKNPERVVGLHFFNPVNRMPLVEVIRAEKTSDAVVEQTIQFARGLGKTVIVVKDRPGFLVNRLLLPYMNEAAYLLEEGVAPRTIDKIATDFGMPMGPIELTDQVGVDVGYKVAHILEEAFGERMKVADILKQVYDKKFLGKKTGKGFYAYSGKAKTVNTEITYPSVRSSASSEDALKRMIYIMINEAARCLEEGVIDSAGTVDIGMVMGTGFPPFRAGLLSYADSIGLDKIIQDLKRFQETVSKTRFQISPTLEKLASEGKRFYS